MYHTENSARILVVEDDADILKVLCAFLKCAGFEVRGIANGQEAIWLIPEFSPHLLVLDLMMQPVSGFQVLEWLHTNCVTPPLPVLVLTARTHLTDQLQGLEKGAIEYVTKPTQPSLLVERIRYILSLSEEQRTLLRCRRIDEQRRVLERVFAPLADEFVY
jgi:DNA-binding response OmpR family regulator